MPGASKLTGVTGLNNGTDRSVADKQSYFKESERSLREVNLLAEAPPEKIAELEACCEWLEYDADEIIVNLKDESTNVFFIIKGKLYYFKLRFSI